MLPTDLMARAAVPMITMVRTVTDDQLDRPTPCAEWTVRRLADHLLYWGPSLEAAAQKRDVPPPDDSPENLVAAEWADALDSQIHRTVEAWSEPTAWDGVTRMGAPADLPASLVGGMVVGEFVVHGWDLGRGLGLHPDWDDDVLEYLYDETAKNAEAGREMEVYGPAVPVPETAPTLARILGLTGRDPAWSAPSS